MTTKSETTYLCACGAVHEEWETSQERAWDDVMASCTTSRLLRSQARRPPLYTERNNTFHIANTDFYKVSFIYIRPKTAR